MERSKLPLFSLEPRLNWSASVVFPKSRDQTMGECYPQLLLAEARQSWSAQTATLLAGTANELER